MKSANFASQPPPEAQYQGDAGPSASTSHGPPKYTPPPPPGYPAPSAPPESSQYAPPPQVVTGTPHYQPPAPQPAPVYAPITHVQTRVPFFAGHPAPVPPPGYTYVYNEQISPIAILLCILLFPWGVLFLLCMKERYWMLQPIRMHLVQILCAYLCCVAQQTYR